MERTLWNLFCTAVGVAVFFVADYFYGGDKRKSDNKAMRRHVNRVGQQDGWRM